MPSVEVEIEVYCAGCGSGICNNTNIGRTRGRGQQFFDVTPCENCLEKAREEGEKIGYQKAVEEFEKVEGRAS